ncbi:MAG: hypothetical protein R2867_25880 [Caldilineaceae bacterium]
MDAPHSSLSVAMMAIARPTFDVPLAQSVADMVLAQVEAASCRVVGTRNELLMDGGAAIRAIDSLAHEQFDLLLVLQASFADSSMVVQIAEAMQARGLPLLLWAVPDHRDGGRLRLNSFCGINLAGHALHLRTIPYAYLLTPPDDPAAIAKVRLLARVGRARRQLQQARIGLIGVHPTGFDTCAYDSDTLRELVGVTVIAKPLAATLQAAAAVDDLARQAFVERVATRVPNLDELDQRALAGTAGVYCALREMADRERLNGVAVRCWPEFFTELGCAACGAMSMLNEEHSPASCEADVNGTVTSLLLQALSGEAAFITDLVSIESASNTGVLWHCGLAPFSMADPEAAIVGTVHSNRKLPLLFEFPLKPGRVTIARLHRTTLGKNKQGEVNGTPQHAYQLVIGGGEMLRAPKSFGGTSGVIRFDQPAATVLDTVMRHGLEHHFCITYGDFRAELLCFAELVGLPVLELT